jgi:hypothetical protein
LDKETSDQYYIQEFKTLQNKSCEEGKFEMLMAMIHLISKQVSCDVAFKLIQSIECDKNHSQSNIESQLIISKIFLLTSSSTNDASDMIQDIINEIPIDLDINSNPFKCCQV